MNEHTISYYCIDRSFKPQHVDQIKQALGPGWTHYPSLDNTLHIFTLDNRFDDIPITKYRRFVDRDDTIQTVINIIKHGGSLYRVEFRSDVLSDYIPAGHGSIPLDRMVVYYRFKPHEFRMMQLLAEPPVSKDILRHIYCFIKK
jgi:hypothetical protein